MNKKTEIDFLNTLFCLMVIFIHVISAPVTELDKSSAVYFAVFAPWRLSAFVVQGFIFLSGMKLFLNFNPEKRVDYVKYYRLRFGKIVLPYIICVCIYYLYFLRNGYFTGASARELILYIIKGDLVSHYYFVIIIIQFYLLRPLWELMLRRISAAAALIVSLAVTILLPRIFGGFAYNDRIFTTYLIYWTGGCFAGAYYERFTSLLKKNFAAVTTVFAVVTVCEAVFSFAGMTGRARLPFLEELHVLYCISAIIFIYDAALRIGSVFMRSKILRKINEASYYIYLIHCLFIYIINGFMERMGRLSTAEEFFIRAAFTYIVSSAICIIYLHIKKETKVRIGTLQ